MDNRNLTAYGLYSPEQCENVLKNFSGDDAKTPEDNERELREVFERLFGSPIQRIIK